MQRAAGELFSHAYSFPPRIQSKQNSHHGIKHSCLSAEYQMKVVLHEEPFILLNISELPLIKASFKMWKSWSCLQIIIDFNGKCGNLHKVRKGCLPFYSGKISTLSPFLDVKVERNLHFVDCLIFCSCFQSASFPVRWWLQAFQSCFTSCGPTRHCSWDFLPHFLICAPLHLLYFEKGLEERVCLTLLLRPLHGAETEESHK